MFLCLFGVLRPTREFFCHMETSAFSEKGCTFWPILGTHGHWAAMVLQCSARTATCIFRTSPRRGLVRLTPVAKRSALEMWLPVLMTWVCLDRGSKPDLPHARRTLYHEVTVEISWILITVQRVFDTIPAFYLDIKFFRSFRSWGQPFCGEISTRDSTSKAYILQPSTGNSQWRPYTSEIFLNGAQNINQSI